MTHTSDRDVYATANELIKQHGADALEKARARYSELAERGDTAGTAVMIRVARAVEELQNREPGAGGADA